MLPKQTENDKIDSPQALEQKAAEEIVFPENQVDTEISLASPEVTQYMEAQEQPPEEQREDTGYERDPFVSDLANNLLSSGLVPEEPQELAEPETAPATTGSGGEEEDFNRIAEEKIIKPSNEVIETAQALEDSKSQAEGKPKIGLGNMPRAILRGSLGAMDALTDWM